jgi:ABC-type branched-subunit amino acid transport system ATPase component
VIKVDDLTVRFGGVTPIDGMTVEFPGGTCGLIGPNGAGKTTFFNVLSGFVRPATGTIHADGENLLAMADYRRARWGLRRTFQTEQAIEELSVYDNVAMVHEHSKLGGGDRADDVVGAIRFVGLDLDPHIKVGGLGARERRLVEVARAVVGRPRLVLLDEPTAGVNPVMVESIETRIRELNARGLTFLVVEHNMNLVMRLCDPVIVLDHGTKLAEGKPDDVRSDPRVLDAYLGA